MTHNEIQDLCSGDDIDFAFGEVYGLRQWQVRAPSLSSDNQDPSLIGHYSKAWHLGTNEAQCYASQGGTMRLALTPEECRGRVEIGSNPIDVMIELAKKRLLNRGILIENLETLNIEGGEEGGTYRMNTVSWTGAFTSVSKSFKHPPIAHRVAGSLVYAGDRFKPRIRLDRIESNGTRVYVDIDTGESTVYRSISDYTSMRSQIESASPIYYEVSWKEDGACDSIAQPSCVCGFYAYTDLESIIKNSYNQPNSVFGLIRGHGKVTIGTKGFRAEKADIIALAGPVRFKSNGWPGYTLKQVGPSSQGFKSPKFVWEYLDKPEVSINEMQRLVRGTKIKIFENPDQLLEFARVQYGLTEV